METKELNETTQLVNLEDAGLNLELENLNCQNDNEQTTLQQTQLGDEPLNDGSESNDPEVDQPQTPSAPKKGVWRQVAMGGVKALAFGVAGAAASVGVAAAMSSDNSTIAVAESEADLETESDETEEGENSIVDTGIDTGVDTGVDVGVDVGVEQSIDIETIEENLEFLSSVFGVEVPSGVSSEAIYNDMVSTSAEEAVAGTEVETGIGTEVETGTQTETVVTAGTAGTTTTTTTTISTTTETTTTTTTTTPAETPTETEVIEDSGLVETSNIIVDPRIATATVSDDSSFSDAFKDARAQVGAGGVFEWRGNLYNTYSAEEWDSISEEDKSEFASNLSLRDTYASNDTVDYSEDFYAGVNDDEVQVISTEDGYEDEYLATEAADDNYIVNLENSAHLGLNNNEEDVILANSDVTFEEILLDDGSYASVGYTTLDGDDLIAVDYNQDGVIDLMIYDTDGDGEISDDEYFDLTGENFTMSDFGNIHDSEIVEEDVELEHLSTTLSADDEALLADFNNNADVSDFIA